MNRTLTWATVLILATLMLLTVATGVMLATGPDVDDDGPAEFGTRFKGPDFGDDPPAPYQVKTIIGEPAPASWRDYVEAQARKHAERQPAPGYMTIDTTTSIGAWFPKLPGPLGRCNDEDTCRDNAQSGCDGGCPGSGEGPGGDGCGSGPVTEVEADGDSCYAVCGNGHNVYTEICPADPNQ